MSRHDRGVLGGARGHLRERQEGASVIRPADNLRQVRKLAFLKILKASAFFRERMQACAGGPQKLGGGGVLEKIHRI